MKSVVKAECSSCGGTGIYCGFAEPKGVGVVCLNCKGNGHREIEYVPFTGLKKRFGIDTVRLSNGSFIATGIGPTGTAITYEDFLQGKRPR
jgi:hypothetical protein